MKRFVRHLEKIQSSAKSALVLGNASSNMKAGALGPMDEGARIMPCVRAPASSKSNFSRRSVIKLRSMIDTYRHEAVSSSHVSENDRFHSAEGRDLAPANLRKVSSSSYVSLVPFSLPSTVKKENSMPTVVDPFFDSPFFK